MCCVTYKVKREQYLHDKMSHDICDICFSGKVQDSTVNMAYMNPQPTSSSMQEDIHTAIEMDNAGKNGLRNRKQPNSNNSNNRPAGFPEEKMKRIDYVLVYNKKDMDEISDSKKKQELKKTLELRDKFENELLDEGIEIQTDEINEVVYQKLHTPFYRLCQEAEKVKLEMPLIGVSFL